MSSPSGLQYSDEHEWVRIEGEEAYVGVTLFAAESLGDIVYVELPTVGTTVSAGIPCGEIESTKSVSDLVAPVTGDVVAVNDVLVGDPSLANTDPYGEGWLYKVVVTSVPSLRTAEEYDAYTGQG